MPSNASIGSLPAPGSGFSIVLVERLLHYAESLGLGEEGAVLPLGNPSNRVSAYRPALRGPPLPAPPVSVAAWPAAAVRDLSAVVQRAAYRGRRLYRAGSGAVREVEDTAATVASAAWRRWLQQPIQLRLRLTG